MFIRTVEGGLLFERLSFECYIADLIKRVPNISKKDLKWMAKCLVDSVQLAVWEYATYDMKLEDWEDLYMPL